jgi:(1->4)-alpha-D-glucan 1-alpha-D-glucosylmutase
MVEQLEKHAADKNQILSLCDEIVSKPSDGRIKLWTTLRTLGFRREHPQLFQAGNYHPLHAHGENESHVVGFTREHQRHLIAVLVPRLAYTLSRGEQIAPLGSLWKDTTISLPRASSQFLNILTGEVLTTSSARTLSCGEVFGRFPAALLMAI